MASPLALLVNAARRLDAMFPGYFQTTKHNHYADFGWPETLTFEQLYAMYSRNGIARAAVEKTILKTWQSIPAVWETEDSDETRLEKDIRTRFADLRVWQKLAETDRRSLVGGYSGAILRLADSKGWGEPVETVPGGLDGLVEVIPAWAGQLTVAEWNTDHNSDDYGKPRMFQFNEAAVGREQKQRQMTIHPDRVLVWSHDMTTEGRSLLEPGYNALMDIEKVVGSGGEGFWKNAKSAPVLQVDKEATISDMAKAMGIADDKVHEAMNDQVEDWQKGFDRLLMLQGMEAKILGVTLPSPEHFMGAAMQVFAASVPIPMKILVGSQSGERASTEDANEWAQTNMARRSTTVIPAITEFIDRLERFAILPERDWHIEWDDLTEATVADKIEQATKMADINVKMRDSGEFVFTPDEIREVVGRDPLGDGDAVIGEPDDSEV